MKIFNNNRYPRRGEIYYVKKGNTTSTGSETWSNRHAVIVSANHANKTSNVVQIVYITTQPKPEGLTHVDISTRKTHRTALCEQIVSIDKSRIVEYKGKLSEEQMLQIDRGMAWNLNLFRYMNFNTKYIDRRLKRVL